MNVAPTFRKLLRAKHPLTRISSLIILSALLFTVLSEQPWLNPKRVIHSDVNGYYAYLPALFVHDDLKFENLPAFDGEVWYSETENGERFIKYTCGMSILYSPFFLVAHQVAGSMDVEANGYTYPYRFALVLSGLVYALIGLLFIGKFLLRYFSDATVSIVLLILYAGTNLWSYTTLDMTYSHGYSFALISVFLYCGSRWLDQPTLKWTFWTGLSAGLFVLIRPIDVVFLLFLVVFGVHSITDLKNRLLLLWKSRWWILLMIVAFLLPLLPQLLYFKYIFGSFMYYSYSKESFFFLQPHLWDSVFSYRNGWLVYSPLMVFALIGFLLFRKKNRSLLWFPLIAFVLYYYIIASWWCWWYVGFGNRAFINLYPLLSIPLAIFVQYILTKRAIVRLPFKVIALALIVFNVFQTYQFQNSAIHYGAMTKAAYWNSLWRTEPSQTYADLLRHPDIDKAMQGKTAVWTPSYDIRSEFRYDFDKTGRQDTLFTPYVEAKNGYQGSTGLHFPEGTGFCLEKWVSLKGLTHMYVSTWVKSNAKEGFTIVLSGEDSNMLYHGSEEVVEYDGDWRLVHLNAFFPNNQLDSAKLYIWNQSGQEFWMDDYQITGKFQSFESLP